MAITHPNFGVLPDDRVIMFDTTLRDGEQSPGFSMNLTEKLRMAEALADLGVDVIEAGFPIASPGDFESVKLIAEQVRGPVIAGLARTGRADILRAAEAVAGAERPRIHIFLSTSPLHMKYKLKMEPEAVLQLTIDSVTLARNYAADVEWSAEDGSRTEPDFLCRCAEAAIRAGATTINIPDTVGYSLPEDMERIFTMLRERVPGADNIVLSTHCHNDLGLAVANGPATRRWRRWRWPSAPGTTRSRTPTASRPSTSCGSASCCRRSPGSTCSRTRRSSGATRLPMRAASTRTAY
jgi:2-isopropylmalate synthase